jgi:hypothetical protein
MDSKFLSEQVDYADDDDREPEQQTRRYRPQRSIFSGGRRTMIPSGHPEHGPQAYT